MRRFDHSGFERSRLHDAALADDSFGEPRCFYKGKAHNLGVYKDVGVANEHATDFRNLGPDGYLTKYGKWGTV